MNTALQTAGAAIVLTGEKAADGTRTHNIYLGKVALYH